MLQKLQIRLGSILRATPGVTGCGQEREIGVSEGPFVLCMSEFQEASNFVFAQWKHVSFYCFSKWRRLAMF